MSNLWVVIIASGAAILSSSITSYLTHYFAQKRNKRECELKWLEERFTPALDFLGRVFAIISNARNIPEGRKQIVDEIQDVVVGSSKENNAWCIAVLLDPEDTELRDQVHSAMTYARIAENDKEFTNYQIKLHWGLEMLAGEFRRERQAIISGKSLDSLIKRRKIELEKLTYEFEKALHALENFCDGKTKLDPTLRILEKSHLRGESLDLVLSLVSSSGGQEKRVKLEKVRRECRERGLIPKDQRF